MTILNKATDWTLVRERQAPIVCFSHLRWEFVLQRPQHLMRRFAADRLVFFLEEPVATDQTTASLETRTFGDTTVIVLRPHIPQEWEGARQDRAINVLLRDFMAVEMPGQRPVFWFYTPMMLQLAEGIEAAAVVYDCMDELSGFRFAP